MQPMMSVKKTMGRPTTRIDTTVLIALRKELGLSQEELAEKVYASARKSSSSNSVLKNTAQRWETKGTISANLVLHLADALGTTPQVLKGEVPAPAPDRIDELISLLQTRAEDGIHAELNEAIECSREEGEEIPVEGLAREINQDLEVAQLTQEKAVFDRISSLTGLTKRALCRPTSHNGIWLLIASGPLGPPRYELLFGVVDVLFEVDGESRVLSEKGRGRDLSVSFSEEGQWFKVKWISSPRRFRTFRFVRCQPSEKGLAWVAASDNDRFWLYQLPGRSYPYAGFVTDFDGIKVPAQMTSLRLVLKRYPSEEEIAESGGSALPVVLQVWEGALPSLTQPMLESFIASGDSHCMIINWLAVDLWEYLRPALAEWPLEYWSFRVGSCCINVMLDLPWKAFFSVVKRPAMGYRFRISLAEMTPDGGLRPSPWTDHCASDLHSRLTQALKDAQAASVSARG